MSIIRILDSTLISRIAAGEVVERPASVVKELVENALDAGALDIDIQWECGGQSLLAVDDNGCGMTRDDLPIAILHHATSKLPNKDLWNIQTFGFRGEALAAISSVARVTISSRHNSEPHGWSLSVEGGKILSDPTPCARTKGTRIEVRDLFFSTPARQKFMRTPDAEEAALVDTLENIAMVNPAVAFNLRGKKSWVFAAVSGATRVLEEQRMRDILGTPFIDQAFFMFSEREGHEVEMWAGIPTFHRSAPDQQLLFVNQRPIRDRSLSAIIRATYSDLMPRGRFPVFALSLSVPPEDLDVNVHPAKTEVRFRNMLLVRQLVSSTLKLKLYSHKTSFTSTPILQQVLPQDPPPPPSAFLQDEPSPHPTDCPDAHPGYCPGIRSEKRPRERPRSVMLYSHKRSPFRLKMVDTPVVVAKEDQSSTELFSENKTQFVRLNKGYVLIIRENGLTVMDPHAAHERIIYECMKTQWDQEGHHAQFLVPSITLELTSSQSIIVQEHQERLKALGFTCVLSAGQQWELSSVPSLLGAMPAKDLFYDVLSMLCQDIPLNDWFLYMRNALIANWACKKSVTLSGALTDDEMEALLDAAESSLAGGQCNHGRPVFFTISLSDIEKKLGRI